MSDFRLIINYQQHCAQRKPPVFNLLRCRFWRFSPRRGDTLHRWGCNLVGRLHAKFHYHRCNDKGLGPQKLKFLLRFDQYVEYKRPAGAYPLRDLNKICKIYIQFQDALGGKISLSDVKFERIVSSGDYAWMKYQRRYDSFTRISSSWISTS